MKMKKTKEHVIIDVIVYTVLSIVSICAIIPFLHIIAAAFSTPEGLVKSSFLLFPTDFSFEAMKYVLTTNTYTKAMGVSVLITVLGTFLSMLLTTMFAYPLAQRELKGRTIIMSFIVVTMVFNPGLVPTFLNVKNMGLYDSPLAMILPGVIITYNMILVKNYYQSMPEALRESAKIDGANDFMIYIRIILPLAKPVLATVTLFYAVGYWNSYVAAMLYIDDLNWWPIQYVLRNLIFMAQGEGAEGLASIVDPESLKSATILMSTIPILCVYPVLQQHFVKGLMMGSVKG